MKVDTIENINCIDGIVAIPDKSINAIITDPPYSLGLTSNGRKGAFYELALTRPFFEKLFQEFRRVLTDDGVIYFFTDWRGYAFYYPIFDDFLGANNMIAWDKGSAMGSYYTYRHELIILHSRKILPGAGANVITTIPGFSAGAKKEDGEKIHNAQKPTALIRKLISDSTQEGDIILDCFMGSGTTAVACIQTGRHYIGYEISAKNYAIATRRIESYRQCI